MNNQATSDNKMETMPVGRLLASMSLPMMASFLIQALYNIVDSIFVAQISEDALTAVSLAFPMQMIMHALAVGIGVGINAAVPRHLGKKDPEGAGRAVGTALFMNAVCSLTFLTLGLLAVPAIYHAQTNVPAIVDSGIIYLRICWCVSFGEFFGQIFEKMLVASGHPTLAMEAQAVGAIFNIIFDPLLIFGLGPFPKLGIAGAALATVLGQVLGGAIALILNFRKNHMVRVRPEMIRWNTESFKEVMSVGFPSMITIGLTSITAFSINQILLTYSTTATAVYGVWNKLQNFCYMPLFGMNNGMVPILSYNHARKRNDRVWKTVRLALMTAGVLMISLCIVLQFLPTQLLTLFDASENMMAIGTVALRWTICSLPFGGMCIILTTSMQALQHSRYTLTVNILRQLVLLVSLFALISAITHNLNLVWAAVPIAELISMLISIGFEIKMWNDLKINNALTNP